MALCAPPNHFAKIGHHVAGHLSIAYAKFGCGKICRAPWLDTNSQVGVPTILTAPYTTPHTSPATREATTRSLHPCPTCLQKPRTWASTMQRWCGKLTTCHRACLSQPFNQPHGPPRGGAAPQQQHHTRTWGRTADAMLQTRHLDDPKANLCTPPFPKHLHPSGFVVSVSQNTRNTAQHRPPKAWEGSM